MDATMKNKKGKYRLLSLSELKISSNPFSDKINPDFTNQINYAFRNSISKKNIVQSISIILITQQILLTN
jgi:hypothetical protein